MPRLLFFVSITLLCFCVTFAAADYRTDPREQALSDTLDLWREGRFEQLYDGLSHRNRISRERFIVLMRESSVRPACCHQKLNSFRLIIEKLTTATVYARIGLEGGSGADSSLSKEFTLDHQEGRWKVRLADIKSLAGMTGKVKKKK